MAARARRGSLHGAGSLTAPSTEPRLRRLVLVGAGRANLHLLRALTRPLVRGLELVLVSSDRVQYDPSMTSGLLRGAYTDDVARIDVAAVAERAGARVVHAQADRFAPDAHVLHAGTERIVFDLCVIDEVGPPVDADRPGVADHAIAVRPASGLADARRALEARLVGGTQPLRCTVVGGGSTGVECAFALQRMLRVRESGGVVTIVDGAPAILGDLAPCRELARRALEREGVCFALGAPVIAVRSDSVLLAYGGALPSDVVLWATGGAAPRLIVASGLPHDDRGRLLVDEALRTRTGAPFWAAGDCAAAGDENREDPRHEAELLERELRAHLGSARRRIASPRSRPLCLLDTGDGRAILRWGRVTARSRLAWWLKRRLDRRFVARLGEA